MQLLGKKHFGESILAFFFFPPTYSPLQRAIAQKTAALRARMTVMTTAQTMKKTMSHYLSNGQKLGKNKQFTFSSFPLSSLSGALCLMLETR